ncbi:MAG TPA: ImmA/IrrE family metallo-endopeptidase [Desulfobacteraceae bacterium]|nr:ImmA/IrrE family metallo-endopeptidase [Desulfobacteraceae bacterium]HPJ67095.1 ImmA/IrrE family metallo-endopeptidase [Desulfobacteraceae bacterium]HPQ29221.1 ImmA/IrrE family metallo-endopeptidase [Desulfobacteraceae bacterium]
MLEEQRGAEEAEKLIEELSFDSLPIIPNEVAALIDCANFRLVLEEKEFDSDGILGKAQGNSKGALIYVNANISDKRRKNFTAAHELGHVCMHIMHQKKLSFECGKKEIYNQFNDPIEKEANGFASGLLMPKRLISPHFNGDVTWQNIYHLSEMCDASLEATYRRLSGLDNSPTALIIHENGAFKRFVPSNFDFFIERSPLSSDQQDLAVNVKEEAYPSDFETVDASDWINPRSKGICLESVYVSTILLNEGFTYTILTYDDDCLLEDSEYY